MKNYENYKQVHREGVYGISSDQFQEKIDAVIPKDVNSILDYGCGQSLAVPNIATKRGIDWYQYDPCVDGKDTLPERSFDYFYCGDVLEHIPDNELDEVLTNIWGYANQGLFVIATALDRHVLPDGSPAHCTVHPVAWWMQRLKRVFSHVSHVVSHDDSFRCWVSVSSSVPEGS